MGRAKNSKDSSKRTRRPMTDHERGQRKALRARESMEKRAKFISTIATSDPPATIPTDVSTSNSIPSTTSEKPFAMSIFTPSSVAASGAAAMQQQPTLHPQPASNIPHPSTTNVFGAAAMQQPPTLHPQPASNIPTLHPQSSGEYTDDHDCIDFDTITEDDKSFMAKYIEDVHEHLKSHNNALMTYLSKNNFYLHKSKAKEICCTIGRSFKEIDRFYYRTIYVWLPDTKDMSCPTCMSRQIRTHGWSHHPGRRVISMRGHYFIISRRYKCLKCEDENQPYTFMGTNEEMISNLDFSLSQKFPALLTHRSGVDKKLLEWFRPLINFGIRTEQIARMLLEFHTKNHTSKFIQYELMISNQKKLALSSSTFPIFSTFDNPLLYDGKVPSGRYIEEVYIKQGSELKTYMDNDIKKRIGEVIKLDASYKIPKLLYQTSGKPLFHTLITGTNEHNEIRLQWLTPTDGHDQYVEPLQAYTDTLDKYGQEGPKYAYVDNTRADKQFLVSILPSIKKTEKNLSTQIVAATSKSEESIHEYNESAYTYIKTARECSKVCDALIISMNSEIEKVLSLDVEWNYRTGVIGTIQIGYFDNLAKICKAFVFHVTAFGAAGLPERFRQFLVRDDITFVGRQVKADLKKINDSFNLNSHGESHSGPRCIDLAHMAKTRGVVKDARVGLADLSKLLLKKELPKPHNIRLSDWDRTSDLSAEQVKYAAYDAIVSLEVYRALIAMVDLSARLTNLEALDGLVVDIMINTLTCCGCGTIMPCGNTWLVPYEGVEPKQLPVNTDYRLVKVQNVLVPYWKVPRLKNKGKPAILEDFNEKIILVPLVMLRHHDKRLDEKQLSEHLSPTTTTPHSLDEAASVVFVDGEYADEDEHEDNHLENDLENDLSALTKDQVLLIAQAKDLGLHYTERLTNKESKLGPAPSVLVDRFSSVLVDIFHLMYRPKVPTKHELKKAYHHALREAFFIWDDKRLTEVIAALMDKDGVSQKEVEDMLYYDPTFFLKCVPRIVPPPSILYFRIRAVFEVFGPQVDSKTKKTLFNDNAYTKAKEVLNDIVQGYASDPPGFNPYSYQMDDKNRIKKNRLGFPILSCARGTNSTECVHKQLLTTFHSWHTGVRMSVYMLAEFRLRYNHSAAIISRQGYPKIGHYDLWYLDLLKRLVYSNHGINYLPGWISSSDLHPTNENFSLVSLQDKSLTDLVKAATDSLRAPFSLSKDNQFLAKESGVPIPFLPFRKLDDEAEDKLFANLLLANPNINDRELAKKWCSKIDGISVFPKLAVHMKIKRESFTRNLRIKDSVKRIRECQMDLVELRKSTALISDRMDIELVPKKPYDLNKQLEIVSIPNQPDPALAIVGSVRLDTKETPQLTTMSVKRGQDKRPRKPRTCSICKSSSCPGSGKKSLCTAYAHNIN